jgi:hypothetical protein
VDLAREASIYKLIDIGAIQLEVYFMSFLLQADVLVFGDMISSLSLAL